MVLVLSKQYFTYIIRPITIRPQNQLSTPAAFQPRFLMNIASIFLRLTHLKAFTQKGGVL